MTQSTTADAADRTEAPSVTYRLVTVVILLAVVITQNLGCGLFVLLEGRVMLQPHRDFSGAVVEIGWPIRILSEASGTLNLSSWYSKTSPLLLTRDVLFDAVWGFWLVYATYTYFCQCYVTCGWRLNVSILIAFAVVFVSLFIEHQERYPYGFDRRAISDALFHLIDVMTLLLLFCGFLLLLEKLSQGWRWLVAKKS